MDSIRIHDQTASDYDEQVQKYDSYGHDVLFGLMYEYLKPGDRLLDIGIGTGLSSHSFARAGLRCFGVDGSRDMLATCQAKRFAVGLARFDISNTPLPFSNEKFNIVIACGVFHFFPSLEPLIKEISRMSSCGSLFGFSIAGIPVSVQKHNPPNDILDTPTAWGVNIYQHSNTYVENLLQLLGYAILKRQKVLIKSGTPDADDLLFAAYVARKTH